MDKSTTYIPSRLDEKGEALRRHGFTRWMSRDLLQAATDFCRNIGLIAIYSEHNANGLTRYLLWNPPADTRFEVRSGRTEEQFRAYDLANAEQGRALLTLHINEEGIYSAVWISPGQRDAAVEFLAQYRISPAERKAP